MVSPRFVARGEELRRLEAALDRARAGHGGAVFLAGEAGIGKTRLAQEALVLARERGFLVLEARAYPLESELSYAPILGLFGPFLRRLDGPRQMKLVGGLPELGRLFGDLHLPAPQPLGNPDLEKTRLFEALARMLERLSLEQPVALLLDDLHAADAASVELLHYVIRGLGDQRALVLAAYRIEALGAAGGPRALVRSLERVALAEELVLPRLSEEEVATLAAVLLGAAASPQLAVFLYQGSRGTPLFVEALVRALTEGRAITRTDQGSVMIPGGAIVLPAGIQELIVERLARLAPVERQLAELVALAGGPVAHAVLSAAAGLPEETLLAALRQLRAGGLLAEELDGFEIAYRLEHPLLAEVVYAELPEMTRRRTHATLAAVLERLRPDGLERLAFHYSRAGGEASLSRALELLVAAGERARDVYANDQAAQHFGAALALVRQGIRPAWGGAGALLPWLLDRLGEALERTGEGGAAIAAWSEALAEYEAAGDRRAAARLRRALGMAEAERGHFEAAKAHLATGLAALAGQEPCQELADLHHARLAVFSRLGDISEMASITDELMALAEQLGAPRAIAEAQRAAVILRTWQGNFAAACESGLRGLEAAKEAGDLVLSYWLNLELWSSIGASGDLVGARAHAQQALDLARRLGSPTMEFMPQLHLSVADLLVGAWREALERNTAALALARRLGQRRAEAMALARRATLLTHRGEFAKAARCLVDARDAFGEGANVDREAIGLIELNELTLALEEEELDRARDIAARLSQNGVPTIGRAGADAAVFRITLERVLQAELAAGDLEAAQRCLMELRRAGPAGAEDTLTSALRLEGLLRQRQGETMQAADLLARAADGLAAKGMPFEAARARMEWAALDGIDRAEATSAGRESLATFERLGAQRYADLTRRLLRRLGAPLRTHPAHPSRHPLSSRELEVARLVAKGWTTAEIAEQLILSPRTVTTHLDHIYARLGIGSRAALRRYVIEAGLLPPEAPNT